MGANQSGAISEAVDEVAKDVAAQVSTIWEAGSTCAPAAARAALSALSLL